MKTEIQELRKLQLVLHEWSIQMQKMEIVCRKTIEATENLRKALDNLIKENK